MIIKAYELEKINLEKNKNFLFYGENQGYKNQVIEEKFKKNYKEKLNNIRAFIFDVDGVLTNVICNSIK